MSLPATHPPILLLGAQRSGTTALAYALSAAFSAVGGIFTVNGKLLYLLARWLTDADLYHRHFRADEILYALQRRLPGGDGANVWLEQVEHVLRLAAQAVADGAHGDALALGRRLVAESYASFSRWGDKYNEYLLDWPLIHALVPDARAVLLIRHPVETATSMLAWPGDRPWRPHTMEAAMEKWACWHTRWLDAVALLPASRYLVIEYHRLCAGKETQRLSDFLGLELTPFFSNLTARRLAEVDETPLSKSVAQVWMRLQLLLSY